MLEIERGKRVLVVVATGREARAVLDGLGAKGVGVPGPWRTIEVGTCWELLVSGIGKVNAGGAVGRVFDPSRHTGAISAGVCGALPGWGIEPLGAVVAASRSVYGDEGLVTPDGYQTCDDMGFPLGPFSDGAVEADAAWLAVLSDLADVTGAIATISTCSGTDATAQAIAARTGAVAEAMEGAAVGHVLARLGEGEARSGFRFGELRVVSNTTGDRSAQRWDLELAFARLSDVFGRLG